jgi:hypothetical protein
MIVVAVQILDGTKDTFSNFHEAFAQNRCPLQIAASSIAHLRAVLKNHPTISGRISSPARSALQAGRLISGSVERIRSLVKQFLDQVKMSPLVKIFTAFPSRQ